jgi:GntR family transcriptional regulator/MocR family aminotransferase
MSPVPPLPVDLSGLCLQPGQELARQLYLQLRERILDGRLPAGARLPAGRQLAKDLGISRNTVIRALEQLYAEGYVAGRIGSGTYVTVLSERLQPVPNPPAVTAPAVQLPASKSVQLNAPRSGAPRAFRIGVPAMDLFPFTTWARLCARFWRKPGLERLGYGDPAGDWQLRELIAAYLHNSRGLHCDPAQILITCGAQQAISLCARILLRAGDRVAIENPCYRAAAHALSQTGAELQGIAVDDNGLDSGALAQSDNCRLLYVTASHQYPSGGTLSLPRRLELLNWAELQGSWIIEDDYDGEYRYSGTPLAPLAALDRQQRVLYVGTFSKIAFPGLRLGYLVLPQALVETFQQACAVEMRHRDIASQVVMAQFIAEGHFQRHIRRMRNAARARRDALLDGWPQAVSGCAPMPRVEAGLHLSLRCNSLQREQQLIKQAAAVGVEINALSDYWLAGSSTAADSRAGLVLGFAAVPEAQIEQALEKLRSVWG